MIEKSAKDINCVNCGAPATVEVHGVPYCTACIDSDSAADVVDMVNSFKED